MKTDLSNAIHITNGDSAAGTVKMAVRAGRSQMVVNEDPIACGPATKTTDLRQWRSVREGFFRDIYRGSWEYSFDEYQDNGLFMNSDLLCKPEYKIVWAASGLSDQLFLAWVIFLCDTMHADTSWLKIVQFNIYREGKYIWKYRSIGELSPEMIRERAPEPRNLTEQEIDGYRKAWAAYTSNDPRDLIDYLEAEDQPDILYSAMKSLVYRYPSISAGLSAVDEDLLRYTVEKGPQTARVIGYTIGMNDSGDFLGDQYIFHRLKAMAHSNLKLPLLNITGDCSEMRTCETRITEFGESVRAGTANALEANGLNDWIGGVHLVGSNAIAVRQGSILHLTASE